VAKSKNNLKPRRNLKPGCTANQVDEHPDQRAGQNATGPKPSLNPIQPQPWLFAISLGLFVVWLLYLAFIAYKVM